MPDFIQTILNAIIWIGVIPAIVIIVIGTAKNSIDQIKMWIKDGEI